MKSETQKPIKDDTLSQHFKDVVGSFLAAIKQLYRDHPALVTIFLFLVLFSIYAIAKAININYIYSLFVTLLFVFLSICLYIKDRSSLSAIFSFSLGIFTAFTVTWNGQTFSIFFVCFIILLIGIFFVASIVAAANAQEKLFTAANFYINDPKTNKKDLDEVDSLLKKQNGLLPIEKKHEAILFFAYQKVPKEQMVMLIEAVNFLYTVTKVDADLLLTLISNIYLLSHTEADLANNIMLIKMYPRKCKSTPSNLVKILNDTLHIAIENNVDFALFTDTILTYLSSGYTSSRIVEKLSAKFTKEAV